MSIDRIGKGAPSVPAAAPNPSSSAAPSGDVGRTFDVRVRPTSVETIGGATASGGAAATAPAGSGSSPLERLRAGEIDLDGYLDLEVQDATVHVVGLRPHEMEGLRSLLREQLVNDPTLADLVQQATGQRPSPKE